MKRIRYVLLLANSIHIQLCAAEQKSENTPYLFCVSSDNKQTKEFVIERTKWDEMGKTLQEVGAYVSFIHSKGIRTKHLIEEDLVSVYALVPSDEMRVLFQRLKCLNSNSQ